MASKKTPAFRIAIIGVGQVGTAAAYSIILASLATELLIVDLDRELRDSQIIDLCDVSYCSNSRTTVRAATHQEARESEIVVITAGSKYNRGETTVQHTYKKISIVRSIVEEMKPFRSDTILLVVANPVDLLTFFAYELSGLPASQVLGSGTFLDSFRVRNLLAQKIKIAPASIGLYTVGLHGDSQIVAWSGATIGGMPMSKVFGANASEYENAANEGMKRLETMIRVKGSTPLGIGAVVSSICSSITSDERNIRPICYMQPEWGCCFSMPAVLGRAGVVKRIDMPLDSTEKMALEQSVKELKATIENVSQNQ